MDEDLLKFIQENKKTRSILDNHTDVIMEMRKANISFKKIAQYLKDKKNVDVCFQNIAQWYKRRSSLQAQTVVINTKNVRVSSSDELDTSPSHKNKGGKEDTKGKDNKVVFSSQDEIKKEDEKSPSINDNDIVPKKKGEQSLEEFIEFNKEIQSSAKEIEERLKKSGVIK